jgi:hypothetical protein
MVESRTASESNSSTVIPSIPVAASEWLNVSIAIARLATVGASNPHSAGAIAKCCIFEA